MSDAVLRQYPDKNVISLAAKRIEFDSRKDFSETMKDIEQAHAMRRRRAEAKDIDPSTLPPPAHFHYYKRHLRPNESQ